MVVSRVVFFETTTCRPIRSCEPVNHCLWPAIRGYARVSDRIFPYRRGRSKGATTKLTPGNAAKHAQSPRAALNAGLRSAHQSRSRDPLACNTAIRKRADAGIPEQPPTSDQPLMMGPVLRGIRGGGQTAPTHPLFPCVSLSPSKNTCELCRVRTAKNARSG
jgi:hypothetical protein